MSLTAATYEFLFPDDLKSKALLQQGSIPFTILVIYVLFTKLIGPLLMKNREPYQLKKWITLYSFTLSILNLYIAYLGWYIAVKYWNVKCGIRNAPSHKEFIKDSRFCMWHSYLSKIVELGDTVFFVLRKKNNQISFLHVFHHSAVVVIYWWALSSEDIGFYLLLTLCINNSIHVMMYLYYGLSAMGPHMQKYLWWKKYLTALQIIQFTIIICYFTLGCLIGCETPGSFDIAVLGTLFLFLLLFFNFYIRSFYKNTKKIK